MASKKQHLKLQRHADLTEQDAEAINDTTPPHIKPVQQVHSLKPAKKSAPAKPKPSAASSASSSDETETTSADQKPEPLKPMKSHPHEPVQFTVNVTQKKFTHDNQLAGTARVPLVISGVTGGTVTLTPRYLTPPKGYVIKNPHQSWKLDLEKNDYHVESKQRNIHFDYAAKKAGTLTVIYVNQNQTEVATQKVDGYVDDTIGLNKLNQPEGYLLSAPVFQPITMTPQSRRIQLSVRGKSRKVIATIQQDLYSTRPTKTSTKVAITGRVGDLKRIQPSQIDVPHGYKIRPQSKEMRLRITADSFQTSDDYPLVIHYVTTQPVYAVINFLDQNQRLVKNQVVKGSWGHYVDEGALGLPAGYTFDRNDPSHLRMTKMVQVWPLQIKGVVKSEVATVKLLYVTNGHVDHHEERTVTINSRVGNMYRIPGVQFYKSGYKPTEKALSGIVGNNGLSKPSGEFIFQRDTGVASQTAPHNTVSSRLSQENDSDNATENEAQAHEAAHQAEVQRQQAAENQQKTADQSIPSKQSNDSGNEQTEDTTHLRGAALLHHILQTGWVYTQSTGVTPDYSKPYPEK